ncbi:NADPH-dependent FMN reductase [Flavobacterium sp. DG1-102-2]|uniref:NADPH-dependent FMN reductase n=1 Tax=Flavobacterium sp. DG1-102-2 TaxID=3081663 RepID=UPI00294A224A|nr:NADPH-dependent FMN reductase [Flavobacterium sp. DG1-102-2]MDV6170088.1 NADPH-dependent FMN reductase [Flavobacterium sp. DG1-102-2]
MKILLFNGAMGSGFNSTADAITGFLKDKITAMGSEAIIFNIDDSNIPMFSTASEVSSSVLNMVEAFRQADAHIWLTPLYHGGMPGAMKNCLDWLELSAKREIPYLTDKKIGLVCWADGAQAMQGINNMDAVAKSLRAWSLPYSIPVVRRLLFTESKTVSEEYETKFDIMLKMLVK